MEISPARRWSIAALMFSAGMINYMDRAIVAVALPLIALDLHLDPSTKGVLLSAFFWSYALMQLPMGWCADRFQLRWIWAGSFALWSLACAFTGLAGTFGTLILLRILLGIGESIYVPGGLKVVNVLFESRNHGLTSAIMNSGSRFGMAAGAPIIAALVMRFGWHHTFFIVGFAGMLWLIPWLAIFPAHVGTRVPPAAPVPGKARSWRIDRNLLGICLPHLGYSYYWYLLVTWIPDYLVVARHMPLRKAGAYAVVPYLVFAVSEPLGGWLADSLIRHGWNEARTRKALITGAYLTSFLLLPAGLMSNDHAAILLMGGASLVGFASGNILALLQLVAPREKVGIWAGALNFSSNLSGVVAPLVTGILIARTGSYYPGFVVAVVFLLACIPFYWWMVGDRRTPVSEAVSCHTA
jgi:MFS family permease